MHFDADCVTDYLLKIPEQDAFQINQIRKVLKENLPQGFEEDFLFNMITYVVPLSIYPKGYHTQPHTPLPFLSIASQKHSINIYHYGIYVKEELKDYFILKHQEFLNKAPNMGKSCIRFQSITEPVQRLLSDLSQKMSVEEFIELYELKRRK